MLTVAGVMLAYDWLLALVAFAVAAPLAFVLRNVQRHLSQAYDKARDAQRRGAHGDVSEVVAGAETLRAYGAGRALRRAHQAGQPRAVRLRSSAPARSARSCSRPARCSACSPSPRWSVVGLLAGPAAG